MEKIRAKIAIQMTAEEITEINKLIEKDRVVDGLMDDMSSDYKWNKCPKCGRAFLNDDGCYCKECGQKIRFVDYSTIDVIPL